jgi:hypothetical protein
MRADAHNPPHIPHAGRYLCCPRVLAHLYACICGMCVDHPILLLCARNNSAQEVQIKPC